MLSIMNKFSMFDANRLLVASITPCVSFVFFAWCFWASIKVISSGMLVTKPRIIPMADCGILNALLKVSNVSPSAFPTQNSIIPNS